jgi:hypothetical protein
MWQQPAFRAKSRVLACWGGAPSPAMVAAVQFQRFQDQIALQELISILDVRYLFAIVNIVLGAC